MKKKPNETSFISFLSDKFGINHKEIHKKHTNIEKMAWEQVLLLAITARQRLFDSYYAEVKFSADFCMRMNLIENALELVKLTKDEKSKSNESTADYDEFVTYILAKLDSGCGIINLTSDLVAKAAEMPESHDTNLYESLLYRIESKAISFSPISNKSGIRQPRPFNYSYYTLYSTLHDPINLFSPLLAIRQIKQADKFCKIFLEFIEAYLANKYSFFSEKGPDVLTAVKKINDLASLQCFMIEHPAAIDEAEIKDKFIGFLMSALTDHVAGSFNTTVYKKGKENRYSNTRPKSMMEKICEIDNKDKLSLIFKKDALNGLLELGQIDAVVDEIKAVLVGKSTVNLANNRIAHRTRPNENNKVFEQLSHWYEQCKTKLFKKLDDIPRLIASIIVFDAKTGMGKVGTIRREFNTKLSSKDIACYVTKITYHCLYKSIPLPVYTSMLLRERTNYSSVSKPENSFLTCIENVDAKVKASEDQVEFDSCCYAVVHFNNSFMDIWANSEVEQTINRIKKLPPFERNKNTRFVEAEKYIAEQQFMGKEQEVNYPLGTGFPLPLWSLLAVESEPTQN